MTDTSTREKVDAAEAAALNLANVPVAERNQALHSIADAIEDMSEAILAENEADVAEANKKLEAGEYSQVLVDRLELSETKIESIAAMVRSVAEQEDPLGNTISARELDDGMNLYQVSVPIGVIGTVFESRPDALVQIASLCLKSGNAVILKGGSEASETNAILHDIITKAASGMPDGWAQLIDTREDVSNMLAMNDAIDLLMPRGSTDFVHFIQDNTKISVLGHAEGICHVYVDEEADLEMATAVAHDAKVQYPAVCNAMETLLVHESVAEEYLPEIIDRLQKSDVEVRGDNRVQDIVEVGAASEDDWNTEYGDLIVSVATVDSLESAVDHVTTYGSKHTESIITEDTERARQFMQGVDSASVFHNVSTRFSDGYRYGLGAEVGISTGKTHARGPVGLEGLTTYKWHIEGDGHIVGEYAGADAKKFSHEDIDAEW